MKKLVGGLGAIALLTLVVSFPASAAIRSLRGLSPAVTSPIVTSPVVDRPVITTPVVTSPAPVAETTVTSPVVTTPTPVLTAPLVTAPVKADTTAVDKAVTTDTATEDTGPEVDVNDNSTAGDAVGEGSLTVDPDARAKGIIKNAPKITIKYNRSEGEVFGFLRGDCTGWFGCFTRYWGMEAYVAIRDNDPTFQKILDLQSYWLNIVSPGGAINKNLKKTQIKPKNPLASITRDIQLFAEPIPVVNKEDAAILGDMYSGNDYSQVLGLDGQVTRIQYLRYAPGILAYDYYTVPVLAHGQKLYIRGSWNTQEQKGDEESGYYLDVANKNYVCAPAKATKGKKAFATRLQVLYGNTPLKQTVERYKDGSCSGVYLIP